jgi:WD40 repeat protein
VLDVAWSPDGAFLATAGHDGIADVWDGATGRLVATLAAHTDRISAVEFSPDARWLVTASWDHTARRWSLAPLLRPAPDPAAVEALWGITLAETLGTTRW